MSRRFEMGIGIVRFLAGMDEDIWESHVSAVFASNVRS